MTREELVNAVNECTVALSKATMDLAVWDGAIEHNVYDSVEAAGILEDTLLEMAMADCGGSHNWGADVYSQDFLVDGVAYRAILKCEYDRYDKTYYYVESHKFEIVKL